MGQESRHGFAWFSASGSYLKAAIKVLAGAAPSLQDLDTVKDLRVSPRGCWLKLHAVCGIKSFKFLAGCWLKATLSSLPRHLLHQALLT